MDSVFKSLKMIAHSYFRTHVMKPNARSTRYVLFANEARVWRVGQQTRTLLSVNNTSAVRGQRGWGGDGEPPVGGEQSSNPPRGRFDDPGSKPFN